jgi:NAD(P)-dependent dehydrogenase (short-subunit alcohol dehydrogenase family)
VCTQTHEEAEMTFLDEKVVVITGAGRGFGAAYAMAAAEAGAAVMVTDVDTRCVTCSPVEPAHRQRHLRLASWVRRWGTLRRDRGRRAHDHPVLGG